MHTNEKELFAAVRLLRIATLSRRKILKKNCGGGEDFALTIQSLLTISPFNLQSDDKEQTLLNLPSHLRCGKTVNPCLIRAWQDILTLHWISEKANLGDIKMMGSQGSSNWDRYVTPCRAETVEAHYYDSFLPCSSHFCFSV